MWVFYYDVVDTMSMNSPVLFGTITLLIGLIIMAPTFLEKKNNE